MVAVNHLHSLFSLLIDILYSEHSLRDQLLLQFKLMQLLSLLLIGIGSSKYDADDDEPSFDKIC